VPPRSRYPLEALRGERGRDQRARTLDMASAVAAAKDADAAAARAQATASAARTRATAATEAARGAMTGGRAGAIAIADRHAALMRRAAVIARDAQARADAGARLAAEQVAAARGELGSARGRAEVVERHRDRWEDDARRARERAGDE